jgi:hypothetical protein
MGYKSKTIHRDEISGLFVQDDIGAGTFSVDELNARAAARQQALNDGNKAEWDNLTVNSPDYGNAMSRMPKPTDYSSKGVDRFGVSVSPGEQEKKRAPRDNSKVSK